MISPFEVYLVMQADQLRDGLSAMVAFLLVAGVAIFIVAALAKIDAYEEGAKKCEKWQSRAIGMAFCGAALMVVLSFIPSSRTIAAMILVPALTSDKVTAPVTKEAGELYALAKQALARLGEPKDEPKPEPEKSP